MHSAVCPGVSPSLCLSVRLSHGVIASKRLNRPLLNQCCNVRIFLKFQWHHTLWGHQIDVGGKICDFRPVTRYITEMMQDRGVWCPVTVKHIEVIPSGNNMPVTVSDP